MYDLDPPRKFNQTNGRGKPSSCRKFSSEQIQSGPTEFGLS